MREVGELRGQGRELGEREDVWWNRRRNKTLKKGNWRAVVEGQEGGYEREGGMM